MENNNRTLARDVTMHHQVSTVFLGLDHNFHRLINRAAQPILFETMVFDRLTAKATAIQERYRTWDEAIAGHKRITEEVRRREDG